MIRGNELTWCVRDGSDDNMDLLEPLRAAIKKALVNSLSGTRLKPACDDLGLPEGNSSSLLAPSKGTYVSHRLDGLAFEGLVEVGEAVVKQFSSGELQELLAKAREGGTLGITLVTRRNLLDELALMGDIAGKLELTDFLSRTWPLDQMPSTDPRYSTAAGDISKHMVMNTDWTLSYLFFNRLDLDTCSDERFSRFLEQLVHPLVRQEEEQVRYITMINAHLRRDGLELRPSGEISGHAIYTVSSTASRGVHGPSKNLIFASNGPKPEIVLSDAINNDIRILRNAEHVLVFDHPIPTTGLTWRALVEWWSERTGADADDVETERALFKRLRESLASSEPERKLFNFYFANYKDVLGRSLPALVPQVYVHLDPLTVRELGGEPRLPVQRMDFLLLFSECQRVVIEVDGKHHYADGDRASPQRYAEMAREDRELRLRGYEVYRFGGDEFVPENSESILKTFFDRLLRKHGLLGSRRV